MHYIEKNRRSFTFIEIVVVTALVSLILLAVYSIFNNGIKIWQRASYELPSEDLNIFLDRFRSDIRNTVKFSGISFSGHSDTLQLATLANNSGLKGKSLVKVIYSYDTAEKILNRGQVVFSYSDDKEKAAVTKYLKNIASLVFQYYSYDTEKKKFSWLDEWQEKVALPLAVRIELRLNEGLETSIFSKTVLIPVSG